MAINYKSICFSINDLSLDEIVWCVSKRPDLFRNKSHFVQESIDEMVKIIKRLEEKRIVRNGGG